MNQPHQKSNATKIFEEALGQHLKIQNTIIRMEGGGIKVNFPLSLEDSATIASVAEYCECSPDDMNPSNNANRQKTVDGYFERLCLNCDHWISYEHMDHYNQVWGFSGYDEANDHDEERIDHDI